MAELTRQELLKLVETTQAADGNERVRRIVGRVVADLFEAIDDLDITSDEFWIGVGWLTRLGASGQTGLITAGLGFDRLLDIREDEKDRRAGLAVGTPRAIEGPLSTAEVRLDDGASTKAPVLVMEGRVLDAKGAPLKGAIVDIWHCNEHGRYSHFDPSQKGFELRRRVRVDGNGAYRFRSFLPPGYAIPPNSPTSELFAALGRHGNRPAHIHFLVSAPGAKTLTTQINIPGDAFIHDDFAFATRDSLIVTLETVTDPKGYESLGITGSFTRIQFDFRLQPATATTDQQHLAREARAHA